MWMLLQVSDFKYLFFDVNLRHPPLGSGFMNIE